MKTIGLARLGRDAEIRYTPSGDAVANLSLAFNYGKADAEGKRPTTWIDASFWGERAVKLAPYLVKGSVHCFTLADIHLETYPKNDGSQGSKLAARVDDVQLGPRMDGGQGAAPAPQGNQGGAPAPRPAPPPAPNFSDMDDDIPF